MSEPNRPSQDQYELIVSELGAANRTLETLRYFRSLEDSPAPKATGRRNLLEVRYPPAKFSEVPRREKLASQIAGYEALVEHISLELDEWNRQDTIWREAQVPAEPVVPVVRLHDDIEDIYVGGSPAPVPDIEGRDL